MINRGPKENSDALLLVEGEDDEHFVKHLHDKFQLNLSLDIKNAGGIDEVVKWFRAEVQEPGRKVLGVIVDADEVLNERWKEIVSILSSKGIKTPATPAPSGTIITSEKMYPKIGIWIMPDNRSSGELEDFAIQMIKNDDEVMPLAQNYIDSIPVGQREFRKNKRTKVELFAWLANAHKPGRIGASISTGKLKIDNSISKEFANWLTRLFS